MRKQFLLIPFAISVVYLFGAVSATHYIFPWPALAAVREEFRPPSAEKSRYTFDDSGRLIADETKSAISCPQQTQRTAVLLVLGQSNASNHAGQRYRSDFGGKVANFFGGNCLVAASPLLGSTDTRGEYWTRLGNLMMSSGKYDNVVIAPLAFSGSEIERWAKGGDINALLVETTRQLASKGYHVTTVLWDQGEADLVKGTSSEDYRTRFLSMVDTLRQQGVDAPVYITIASKCLEPSNGGFKFDPPDNAIVRAQMALPENDSGLRLGVNTDALLDEVDRYDDCHMGGTGEEKVAHAWAGLLSTNPQIANAE